MTKIGPISGASRDYWGIKKYMRFTQLYPMCQCHIQSSGILKNRNSVSSDMYAHTQEKQMYTIQYGFLWTSTDIEKRQCK